MFLTTEDRLTEKLNKEKEYLWTEMNALKEKLEKTNKQLELLEQSAPDHYSKALGARNKATEVKNKAEERLGEIDAIYKSVEDAHELVISLKDESDSNLATIKEYGSTAFDKSESIAQYHEQYLESKAEIDEALQELNRLVAEKDRLALKVESLSEQVTNTELVASKLKSLLSNATKQKNEFDTLHGEVFGFTYEDDNGEEVEQGGLKEELEDAYSKIKNDVASLNEEVSSVEQRYNEKLDSIEGQYKEGLELFISKGEKQYSSIIEQIKSLLPDALTAGLSGAYIDKIKVEKEQLDKHEVSFNKAIRWLIVCSLLPVAFSMVRVIFLSEQFASVIQDAPMIYSMMLPVYAPILWVAYSSNKSYKLSKRLIEEYTHKEVSSRTFEGLSNQIDTIGEDDTSGELRTKLLFNLLQVNSENPGKLISDYNNSDHPIIDAIDKSSKLADAINRLDNVPLVSPLLRHLNAKERNKIEKKEKDMLDVVDVATTPEVNSKEEEPTTKTASVV
ncbi:hypothetical protein A8140_05025 [Vibrio campbellii CAIM 519 = NBRC 15631 = ATCC 25920]|nr:hypothetical protein A8140_05025 [Vibrio campbellii CAIM 519 = NBRC 15631 = ATCC 25920]ELU51945.1 hypothetical protein B878_10527 [Vibrio campbellii CAIM 519 = NBRC 15631 = ATCC 25920]